MTKAQAIKILVANGVKDIVMLGKRDISCVMPDGTKVGVINPGDLVKEMGWTK
jgi:hypothetical protein